VGWIKVNIDGAAMNLLNLLHVQVSSKEVEGSAFVVFQPFFEE